MIDPSELLRLPSELGVDALLVTSPPNVRYLSGFSTPDDGRVLVTVDGTWLVTDARYDAQAAEESRLEVEIRRDWLPWAAAKAGGGRNSGRKAGRLGVEADDLTQAQYQDLVDEFNGPVVPLRGVLRERRMIKTHDELAKLRRAARITDDAYSHILGFLRPGVSEVEVALELERFMRRQGAGAKSFDIVVASGKRSAMPHGIASPKLIESGELVTLDFGAMVDGYHADMTRAVAVGELDDRLRAMYDAVLEAELAALEAAAPGVRGGELDLIARRALAGNGLEEYFAHSVGHGVGLDVHEWPKLSKESSDVLAPGMTVTIEPGVYVPGTGGVRIEDLLVITADGYELLSTSPKELITV